MNISNDVTLFQVPTFCNAS